jgi:hypothetical protein
VCFYFIMGQTLFVVFIKTKFSDKPEFVGYLLKLDVFNTLPLSVYTANTQPA